MIITPDRKALYDLSVGVSMAPLQGSTNVKAVGYDPKTGTLFIDYHRGRTYAYAGIPPELHSNIIAAESPGRFLHENVIGQPQFRSQEVTTP